MSFKEVNVNVGGPKKDAPYTYKEVILKPNKSFAEQVTEPNRKYVIKWDFDLGGDEVTIPYNCVLKFDGGSFTNGTLVGQNTIVFSYLPINNVLKNIITSGTFVYEDATVDKTVDADGRTLVNKNNVLSIKQGGVGNLELDTGSVSGDKLGLDINERFLSIEGAVGTGGSVDERIIASKDSIMGNVSTASDTLEKIENNILSEVERASSVEESILTLYNSLQQSKPVPVLELPVVGEAGKIYRLGGVTSYADYMYAESDLTTPIKLAEYDNAIDDEPIKDSNNLIRSKSVYENKKILDNILGQTENIFSSEGSVEGVINAQGNITFTSGAFTTDYLPVEPLHTYYVSQDNIMSYYFYIIGFYNGTTFIERLIGGNIYSFTTPVNCTHIRCCKADSTLLTHNIMVCKDSRAPFVPNRLLQNVKTSFDDDIVRLNLINLGLRKCIEKHAIKNYYINNDNNWIFNVNNSCYLIPVEGLQSLYIENVNKTISTAYAFLKDKTIVPNYAADLNYKYEYIVDPVSGIGEWVVEEDSQGNPIRDIRHTLKKNEKLATTIPPGTKYLFISVSANINNVSYNNLPNNLVIDGISYCPEAYQVTPDEEQDIEEYSTIFFDDFNILNENIWTLHTQEPVHDGHYNSRFRTDSSNAYVDNGLLILGCQKTATPEDGTYIKTDGTITPVEYRAGYISTQDTLAISAGRISAKMRFSENVTQDLFPGCFWTFGQNAPWGYAHEMDIAESVCRVSVEDKIAKDGTVIPTGSRLYMFNTHLHVSNNPSDNHETYYWLNWNIKDNDSYISKNFITRIDPTKWHVYSVEWDVDSLTYFVDDVPVKSYTAEELDARDISGNIGFYYPQDIRFNIKAMGNTTGEQGYLFVDWVKAEVKNNTPCLSISHDDITLNVGESVYINPVFNTNCSNKAFTLQIEDDGVLAYYKYLTDSSQMIAHRIKGNSPGTTNVILRSANGKTTSSFNVIVTQ